MTNCIFKDAKILPQEEVVIQPDGRCICTLIKSVEKLPSPEKAMRSLVYRLPNNTFNVVNDDGTGYIQLEVGEKR